MSKPTAYAGLVERRKACRRCTTLQNPAAIQGGALDSDELGPYSCWQGCLDATLLVVAQDFADVESFARLAGWPGKDVATNRFLVELLAAAGFSARPPTPGFADDVVFLTNAVLCMKAGGMRGPVPISYYRTCGQEFLGPTVELIEPRAVAALGMGALHALRAAFGVPKHVRLRELVDECPAAFLNERTALFAMYHPSQLVQNTVRPWEEQLGDWQRLGLWLGTRS